MEGKGGGGCWGKRGKGGGLLGEGGRGQEEGDRLKQ